MCSGPLRQEQHATDDKDRQYGRSQRAAEREPAMAEGLVQKVTHRGTERPGKDERRPEQQDVGNAGPVVQHRDDGDGRKEDQRAALVGRMGPDLPGIAFPGRHARFHPGRWVLRRGRSPSIACYKPLGRACY